MSRGHDVHMSALQKPREGIRKKVTVLMPPSLIEDLQALRLATGQSTSELVNELLESHLAACGEDVRAGKDMIEARERRAERRKLREEAGPVPAGIVEEAPEAAKASDARAVLEGSPGTGPMPDDDFIEAVALKAKGDDIGRRRNRTKEYREWCQRHEAAFALSGSLEAFLLSKHPRDSSAFRKNRAAVMAVIDEWEARPIIN